FIAPSGSPAASARAAAVISESMGIPSHLSLPLFRDPALNLSHDKRQVAATSGSRQTKSAMATTCASDGNDRYRTPDRRRQGDDQAQGGDAERGAARRS